MTGMIRLKDSLNIYINKYNDMFVKFANEDMT